MISELKNWLKAHDFDVNDVCEDEEFSWDKEEDIININMGEEPNNFGAWDEFMEELGLNFSFSEKVMAFIHELGHHVTFNTFSEEEQSAYVLLLYFIQNRESSKENCMAYYHLDIEYAASAWAVEYVNSHYEDIMELEEIFKG